MIKMVVFQFANKLPEGKYPVIPVNPHWILISRWWNPNAPDPQHELFQGTSISRSGWSTSCQRSIAAHVGWPTEPVASLMAPGRLVDGDLHVTHVLIIIHCDLFIYLCMYNYYIHTYIYIYIYILCIRLIYIYIYTYIYIHIYICMYMRYLLIFCRFNHEEWCFLCRFTPWFLLPLRRPRRSETVGPSFDAADAASRPRRCLFGVSARWKWGFFTIHWY